MFPGGWSVLAGTGIAEAGGQEPRARHAGEDHEREECCGNHGGGIFFDPLEDAGIKHGI